MTTAVDKPAGVPKRLQKGFSGQLVAWQAAYGRHTLPWQKTRDPYRVWLSEIMLQQTQVVTVLDYYPRFLARFPTVQALAAASVDDVLALWSGLGYYSRARNLHGCATAVVQLHGGQFPVTAAQLQELPGIGRSTAAAIAAFCFDERVAILDANVRRVLTRVLGFSKDLSVASNERLLWDYAATLLPGPQQTRTMPQYTQALMDLGATVCLPRKPGCLVCPVRPLCAAQGEGKPESYPVKSRKLKRSSESLWMLWAVRSDGAVWLAQRPVPGVWAGLYCLPAFESYDALAACLPDSRALAVEMRPVFKHVLTHKDLHVHPVVWSAAEKAEPAVPGQWFAAAQWPALGLPAPVRRLLASG